MRSRLTIAAAILATVSVLAAAAVWLMIPGERDNRPVIAYLNETRLTIPYDYFRFEHAALAEVSPKSTLPRMQGHSARLACKAGLSRLQRTRWRKLGSLP